MIIVLNGPLGIGKSTLAESLSERIDQCVMLDGDRLIAANPSHADALEHLHSTIALLMEHHRRFGYHHFVVDHIWRSPDELADLLRRFGAAEEIRCFHLTLPYEENLRRIERRASARAIDELAFERRTVLDERAALAAWTNHEIGEPFEVDAPPQALTEQLIRRLGLK